MARTPVSGAQHSLRAGDYCADIAGVGASLRTLRHRGRDLIAPFDADSMRPAMQGAILVPWPNRIEDGTYVFDGSGHQLPLNEIAATNAAHGLVAWQAFTPCSVGEDALVLSSAIEPQPGYPWPLRVDVTFALSEDGLQQEVAVTNCSETAAPVGIGGHPYLVAETPTRRVVDEWMLEVPADDVLLTDPVRHLPAGLVEVGHDDGRFDFRRARALRGATVNNAFTSLRRDGMGLTRVRVLNRAGEGAEIGWDERAPWVQIYTADEQADEGHRCAVAVEPMTCPPNAFRSGVGVISLGAGVRTTAGWAIRAVSTGR